MTIKTNLNTAVYSENVKRYLPTIITLTIGLIVSILMFFAVLAWDRSRLEADFDKAAADRMLAIERAFVLNQELLHTFETFLQIHQNEINVDAFNQLSNSFLKRYPFIQSLQWVPRIAESEKVDFEQQKRTLSPQFQINEFSNNRLQIASQRAEYFPIDMIAPLEGNERGLGLDLSSIPMVQETLTRARDTGTIQAISHLIVLEQTDLHGLLMAVPIYKNPQPATVAERQQQLRGFLIGIYQVGEILQNEVMSYLESRPIDIRMYDASNDNKTRFIYFYSGLIESHSLRMSQIYGPEQEEVRLKRVKYMSNSGVRWLLECTPAPGYYDSAMGIAQALMVLTLGIFATLILASLFYTSMHHAYQIAEASENANHAQSRFLANMSHQMRTPVNAIVGYSELLLEEAEELNPTIQQDLEKVYTSARYLLSLSEGILDLSKIKAGQIELHLQSCEISGLVKEVQDIVTPLVKRNNNTLVVHCPDSLGSMKTDITRLHQILFNLLNNVSEKTINSEITFAVSKVMMEGCEWVRFAIHGYMDGGMNETKRLELLDKLVKVQTLTSQEDTSIRMGLVISAHLWHMMDGKINVESDIGKGTTFILNLPLLT